MKRLKSQKGALSFGGIVFLLVVAAVAYVGIKMGMPLVTNFQVKEVFRNEVERIKVDREPKVRQVTLARLEELGVKLIPDEYYEDGLIIYREDEDDESSPFVMEGTYVIHVDFIGGHRYTYKFNPKKVAKK